VVERNNVKKKVKLIKDKLTCPCNDDIYWGIPCRHEVAIFLKRRNTCSFNYLPFNKRWLIGENLVLNEDPETLTEERDEEVNKLNTLKI